jgi:hypothetical protein
MSTSALAQTPAKVQITAGATVFDGSGGQVGTVEKISDGNAVLDTGSHKVLLPLSSFGRNERGPILSVTKAELDASAVKAEADAAAALREKLQLGVSVVGLQGSAVGTVKKIDGEFVELATSHGDARIPIKAIGQRPAGLFLSMSAEDFGKAMKPQ